MKLKVKTDARQVAEKLERIVNEVSREHFEGNLRLVIKDLTPYWVRFSLRVKNSKGPGAKRGPHGWATVSACWHAHGCVIDRIFKEIPDAVLYTYGNVRYTADNWEWVDRNVGSIISPTYHSELCDCE